MDKNSSNNYSKGRLTEKVEGHENRLDKIDEVFDKMWDAINKIRIRPPIWCTVVIAVLVGLLGWLARAATIAG